MATSAIALVKDEADIIEQTVGHMLTQVDHVIVADNCSTDGTRDILLGMGAEHLTVIVDLDPAHYQSRKMTQMAAEFGAEWVIPFDADEIWYSEHGRIADVLSEIEGAVAPAAIINHLATGLDTSPTPRGMPYRQLEPLPLHKVACRRALPVTITEGNHSAHYPTQEPAWGKIAIRHFPYRTPEQFVRKAENGAAALARTDLSEDIGQHWRDYGRLLESGGPEVLHDVFREHFYSADPESDPGLIFDPAP